MMNNDSVRQSEKKNGPIPMCNIFVTCKVKLNLTRIQQDVKGMFVFKRFLGIFEFMFSAN